MDPGGIQIFSFSCSFSGKSATIIGWIPHLCGWHPLLWEVLDPPLIKLNENKEILVRWRGSAENFPCRSATAQTKDE